MKNIEHKDINKIQLIGMIIKQREDNYYIKINDTIFQAKKAVSCLVQPQIGDKVLFFKDEESYILAILQRDTKDIKIKETNLVITTNKLDITSKRTEIIMENINLVASIIDIKTNIFKHLSNSVEKISKIFRQTNEIYVEKTKKRDIMTKINKTTSKIDIKYTDNIIMNATKEIKIDADIINMG